LLDQATTRQARRITALLTPDLAARSTISSDDIPGTSISTSRSQTTNGQASICSFGGTEIQEIIDRRLGL
jgi:hypothetical protein